MTADLTTAEEVLEKLDGVSGTAKLVGATYNQAFNWKAAGRFPSRFYVLMSQELKSRGFHAPASLWGMVEPERLAS